MKKIIPLLLVILFCSTLVFTQNIMPESIKCNVPKTNFGHNLITQTPKSFLNFTDTLAYPGYKATSYNIFMVANNPAYCISVGQYYDCPQSVTIKGVVFYGFAYITPSINVTVELFLAGADSLPTGTALVSQTMAVDSFKTHVHRTLMFNTPQTINQPYIISITYSGGTFPFIIITDNPATNDGKNEWLAVIKQTTGPWKKSKLYSGGSKNLDFMIMPIVKYDVGDASFTMDSTCLSNDGEVVNFTLNCPNVYKNRMYGLYSAGDSTKYQFAWNFGDTEDTIFAMDTSHQYVTAAQYVVTLGYGFMGWYNYVAPQLIQQYLGTCFTPDVSDTLLYPAFKATGNNIFGLLNDPSYCISVGQYYDCPQLINVMGVVFYAYTNPDPSINVTVEMFLAGTDSLPMGTALVSQTIAIDSFQTHAHRVLMFADSQAVNQPYIITINYSGATSPLNIVTNDPSANDGKGEWLALIKQPPETSFKKSRLYSGGAKNFDFYIMPVVKYDIANSSFTMSPACLNSNGDIVNFTLNSPDIYKNRMYDYFAASDSTKYQFAWNFGDTEDTIYAMDTTHQYATIDSYLVTLGYGFKGWYNYVAPQIVQQNISVCTAITENNTDEIVLYPNPVNNILFIENVYKAEIEIYNSNGILIMRKLNEGKSAKIDLTSLSGGIYLVKINHESGITTRKVLVKH